MREYLTSDDICNQISMNRSLFKGTFVITEGNTDQRLYSKFVNKESTRVISAHSKANVLSCIKKMTDRRDGNIIGIVDRDLDELKGRKLEKPVFYTDYRDLEMMLINSNALSGVLSEYADVDRLERFERQHGPIRENIIEAAYPLGLLMYVSFLRGYNLDFKDLDFSEFVDRRNLRMDETKMIQSVIRNTEGCELSYRIVLRDLQQQSQNYQDKARIARGHDSVKVLLIGLKDVFGTYNTTAINEGSLGGSLRLAFSFEDFDETELYKVSKSWAESRGIGLWKLNRPRSPRSSGLRTTPLSSGSSSRSRPVSSCSGYGV